jgi:hypothetical protein
MFDIRYSIREHEEFVILKLPIAEVLAEHMQFISPLAGRESAKI